MSETIKILYQDSMLAVAVKPVGVLSQADRTGEPSMTELLTAQLGKTVFPVHRLDRAVGGVNDCLCDLLELQNVRHRES